MQAEEWFSSAQRYDLRLIPQQLRQPVHLRHQLRARQAQVAAADPVQGGTAG